MRYLGSVLWLVPLSVHIGHLLATYSHLPEEIGAGGVGTGTSKIVFTTGWLIVIGLANAAFLALHLRLPNLDDTTLAVPGQAYWLATEERRRELVGRLRGICEAALLGLNLFFLAVYQSIYQTNAVDPVIRFSMSVLIIAFMAIPLIVIAVVMVVTLTELGAEAREHRDE